jgi:hypothetical protein
MFIAQVVFDFVRLGWQIEISVVLDSGLERRVMV